MIEWATDSTGASERVRLHFAPGLPRGADVSGARALVMVATSGSQASRDATVIAADLARAWGASLRIVHVVAPVQYRVGRLAPMRAVPRRLGDPFDSPVLASARELAWRRGVAATLELLAGDPAPMITAAAARAHADVLVIGANGAERARRRTAPTRRWIEAHAPCPTVTPHTVAPHRWCRVTPRNRASDVMSVGGSCQSLACSLSPGGLRERAAMIDELLARGPTENGAIAGGVRVRFQTGPGLRADLDALVELEARCCAFLALTVTAADDVIVLEVSGPSDARALIAALFSDRPQRSPTADSLD